MLRAAVPGISLALGCLLLSRCSVYDERLMPAARDRSQGTLASMRATSAEPAEATGPAGTEEPRDAGARGFVLDAAIPRRSARDEASGPVPDGPPARIMTAEDDAGPIVPPKTPPAPSCGDGEVNGVEKCDVGIAEGQPGACPRNCPALEPCVPRVLNGSGCQAECALREVACQSGDQCCPGKCTKDNDLDCSAKCGDGIVQASSSETCEDGTDKPCLTGVEQCDDKDPCTVDELQGSAANCNTHCTHVAKREVVAADGCCPEGESANTDTDCQPRCGNNVREQGEECDGGPGCEPGCKLATDMDLKRCTGAASNECERCACMNCTGTEVACRFSPDVDSNALCGSVVSCMQSHECVGNPLGPCYCGLGLICGLPYGPCREPVDVAGKSMDYDALYTAMSDANTPLGRAASADLCRISRCLGACR